MEQKHFQTKTLPVIVYDLDFILKYHSNYFEESSDLQKFTRGLVHTSIEAKLHCETTMLYTPLELVSKATSVFPNSSRLQALFNEYSTTFEVGNSTDEVEAVIRVAQRFHKKIGPTYLLEGNQVIAQIGKKIGLNTITLKEAYEMSMKFQEQIKSAPYVQIDHKQ